MTYRKAKKLRVGDKVNVKRLVFPEPIQITEVQIEEKDVFVRDENGHLYHHTVLNQIE